MLTSDISLGFKTTLSEAEEVKKRLGARENGEPFDVRTLDGRAARNTRQRSCVKSSFREFGDAGMARQKIVENVPRDLVLGEVVLTGGGALLPGIESIAEEVFSLPVRIGTAKSIGGLTEAMTSPQYATAIGLVVFGANGQGEDAVHAGASRQSEVESSVGWRIYGPKETRSHVP